MTGILSDFRFALRMFAKHPWSTSVAALSLALAIGPNATLFSVVDRLFLRPIPGMPEVHQLSIRTAEGGEMPSYPDYLDFQHAVGDAAQLVAFRGGGILWSYQGRTTALPVARVSENFFSALAVRAAIGRTLVESDGRPGAELAAMVSYPLWQKQFGGDPAFLGTSVLLNGRGYRIVGVLPRGFRLPGPQILPVDFWIPLRGAGQDEFLARRDQRLLSVWARLRSPADKPRAEAALSGSAVRLAREFPASNHGRNVALISETEMARGLTSISLLGLSLFGLVVVIACANVAGVLLAQGEARRREFATRLALGARAGRLTRQLLTESTLLALMGAAGGILLAAWLIEALPGLLPPLPMDLDYDIRLDGRVLAYTLLLSLATALACGIYPALRARTPDLALALKGSASRKPGRPWFRSGLLLAQIAASQFLLAGAGLLFRSYLAQQRIEPGFDTGRNLMAAMIVGMERPPDFGQLRDKLRSIPGVSRASYAMRLPLAASGGGMRMKVSVPGVTPAPLEVGWTGVGPDYFSIMGTRLLRGREFRQFEPGSPAVVNAQMARQFWGGPDAAMGRLFRADDRDYQIVGIAEDGKYASLLEETQPWFFVPSTGSGEHVLIAELAGGAGAIMPEVRRALAAAFPDVKILSLITLREHLRIAFFAPQKSAWLMAGLALLGVLLASVGLYAAISNNVNRRAHEIGVRMSVGARPRNIVALVMRQTAWLVGAGCAAGLLAAFVTARVLSSVLYEVSPADPAAVIVSVFAVVAVAAMAAYSPARRAVRLDPMTVLRKE